MGLPNISVIFKQKAETAIKRSGNGIVALILADNTKYIYAGKRHCKKSLDSKEP